MWQPDTKLETAAYPAGGVAPSTYALRLFTYIRKASSRLPRR